MRIERFEDVVSSRRTSGGLANKQTQRNKGNPERFTPFNRVPLGKFNRVSSEPVNAYVVSMLTTTILLSHLLTFPLSHFPSSSLCRFPVIYKVTIHFPDLFCNPFQYRLALCHFSQAVPGPSVDQAGNIENLVVQIRLV